jgi:hypothetical protein
VTTLRQLRKLLLGETWTLPVAVAAAVGLATALKAVADGAAWWHRLGGFVLLALVVAALSAALARRPR